MTDDRIGSSVPAEQTASPMHLLIMGDKGTGKSAVFRQILAHLLQRGETAIVLGERPEIRVDSANARARWPHDHGTVHAGVDSTCCARYSATHPAAHLKRPETVSVTASQVETVAKLFDTLVREAREEDGEEE